MSVVLRERKGKTGIKSYYLDIHANGKRYKEYLGITIKPAKSQEDREYNKSQKELAISIRAKKELELQANDYQITPSFKKNIDFIEYFAKFKDEYKHSDKRIVRYSYEWFVKYNNSIGLKSIKPKQVTEQICKDYYSYMQKHLNGETPYNYFTKFKQVIKKAIKDDIIVKNPTDGIRTTRDEGLKKEILSFDEITQLAKTKSPNQEVKRAFLFSLFTGLRWCDVKELTYKNFDLKNNTFKYTQSKTKHSSKNSTNIIELSPMLKRLVGESKKSTEKVFNLPSHTGALKTLRVWVKNAEIDKRITWHCARHSFAVNQLSELKTDIKTVAALMGHSGLKYVERYTRAIDEKKALAINSQPEIEFE